MRPIPSSFLIILLLAFCGLCAWQWHREAELRQIVAKQSIELAALTSERQEIDARVKAADAEILRLTGSLNDLRTNSVGRQEHDDVIQANTQMRVSIETQNKVIKEQNEKLTAASASILQANETIKKLTTERDTTAKKLNEVTALVNKLNEPKP